MNCEGIEVIVAMRLQMESVGTFLNFRSPSGYDNWRCHLPVQLFMPNQFATGYAFLNFKRI